MSDSENVENEPEKGGEEKGNKKTEKKGKKKFSRAELAKYEKLYKEQLQLLEKRDITIESKRKEQLEKEGAELTFSPRITKRAKDLKEVGYDYRMKWNAKKEENLKKLKKEQEDNMKESMKGVGLSSKTQKIIEKKRKKDSYKNPIDGWDDRFKDYKVKRSEPPVDRTKFNPSISKRTQKLTKGRKREGPVHDRLYLESIAIQKKNEEKRNVVDHTFQPRVSRHSKSIPRTTNVYDDLFYNAKKSELKLKKKREDMIDERSQMMTHQPALNRNSIEIAKKIKFKRKPLYVSPSKSKKNNNDNPNLHSPSNKKRRKGPQRSPKQVREIFDNLYQRNQKFVDEKKRFIEKMKELKVQQEGFGCTFSPRLSKKSQKIIEQKGEKYSFDYGLDKKRVPGKENTQYEKFLKENSELINEHELDLDIEKQQQQQQSYSSSSSSNQQQQQPLQVFVDDNGSDIGDDDDDLEENERERIDEHELLVLGEEVSQKKNKLLNDIKEQDDEYDDDDEDLEENSQQPSNINNILMDQPSKKKKNNRGGGGGTIEDEIDSAFNDWEKLSSSVNY